MLPITEPLAFPKNSSDSDSQLVKASMTAESKNDKPTAEVARWTSNKGINREAIGTAIRLTINE